MKFSKLKSFFFLVVILMLSCQESYEFQNKESLQHYLNEAENGYSWKKSVGNVNYKLRYCPSDLLVEKSLGASVDKVSIENLRNRRNKYIYFNLSLSNAGQGILASTSRNNQLYSKMVNQMSFGMNDKIHLVNSSKDTLEVFDCQLNRTYGMSKTDDLILVFPNDKDFILDDPLYMTIEDFGLNTGEVFFKIDGNKILNEPHIKF